jgi:hypothetical protein
MKFFAKSAASPSSSSFPCAVFYRVYPSAILVVACQSGLIHLADGARHCDVRKWPKPYPNPRSIPLTL